MPHYCKDCKSPVTVDLTTPRYTTSKHTLTCPTCGKRGVNDVPPPSANVDHYI